MTTKKNLVKSMFMNILTAGIFATAFTACSDEIDVEQAPTAEPTTHKTRSFITDDYYNINEKCATPFTRDNWYTHNGIYMRTGNGSFVNPNIKDPEQRTGYCEEILPWATASSPQSHIPNSICKEMTPANGWELVANFCGDYHHPNANYMAFYNKYQGKLRYFYFIPRDVQTNNAADHNFEILMQDGAAEHAVFGYAMPLNGKIVKPEAIKASNGDYFSQYVTPYADTKSQVGQLAPMIGWYAFDVDLSVYRGEGIGNETSMKRDGFIKPMLRGYNQANIDMIGKMTADITGNIDMKKCCVNSTGGVFGPLESVLGDAKGVLSFINDAKDVYGNIMKGDILGAIEGGINVAKQGCDLVGIDYGNEETGFDGYKGEVNMKLNGTLDFSGRISEEAVIHGVEPINQSMTHFDFDGTCLGQGVWNIVDHPVVYYTNAQIQWREDYTYSWTYDDEITKTVWAKGNSPFNANKKVERRSGENPTYTTSKEPWCGYVTYFDPSNIKVILNPNLFTPEEIASAKVYATCGVRKANSAFGSLDNFREAFGLKGSKFGINMKNGGEYYNRPFDEAPYDALSGSKSADKLNNMKTGATFKATNYDGYKCGMFGRGDSNYILMPQPLSGDDHALCTYMPSYEVTVTVIVNHNGKPIVYSRNYLPEYVKMDVADIPFYSDRQISDKCPANYVPAIYTEQMQHINDIHNWTRRTLQAVEGNSLYFDGRHAFDLDGFDKYSESWPMLIDGKKSTKWCTTKTGRSYGPWYSSPRPNSGSQDAWYACFKTNYGVSPTGYTLVNANDTRVFTERRPRVWYIWGKKEQSDKWTKLTYESTSTPGGACKPNAMPNDNFAEKSYKFNEGQAKDFKYFMIEIIDNWSDGGKSCMQLAEFRFDYD